MPNEVAAETVCGTPLMRSCVNFGRYAPARGVGGAGVPGTAVSSRRFDGGVGRQSGWSITEGRVTIADICRSPWNSGVRPRVYRPFEFVIPGTTDAADEMVRHFRHRNALRQSKRQWLDIEMAGWPGRPAFDLKEFPIVGEIAESYRARWWWQSATALGM